MQLQVCEHHKFNLSSLRSKAYCRAEETWASRNSQLRLFQNYAEAPVMYLLQIGKRLRIMPAPGRPQSPVVSSPERRVDSRASACEQSDPEHEVLSASVQGICRMSMPSVCLSPCPLSAEESSLPLLCPLLATSCCDVCVTVPWVMSPTSPLGSQVSGLKKKKAVSESYIETTGHCRSPWFGGWCEGRTFPMGTINFHM